MALDFPYRHAPCVEADDLVIEAIEVGLSFGNDHRFERAGAISGHLDLHLAVLGQKRFAAHPIAAVAGPAACRISLLITDMMGQLRPERALQQSLLQPPEKSVLGCQVFRLKPPESNWSKISGEKSTCM